MVSSILLLDIDSLIPNLALMKLSAWHKAQGDEVGLNYVGNPDKVYAACVFSWNKRKAEQYRMVYPNLVVGGTGVDIALELPSEVNEVVPDYSLYSERFPTWRGVGLGFITRGCPRKCAFCIVPSKEGSIRVVSSLSDLVNPQWADYWKHPFVVLLDNNLLAVPNVVDVLTEIATRKLDVSFSQGLDIRLVTPEIARALSRVRFWNLKHSYRQLTFAFDDVRVEPSFRKGVSILNEAGIPSRQIQSFVLSGFNSIFEEDLYRIDVIRSLGCDPFAMVYRDPITGKSPDRKLRHFARWVNRRYYTVCKWEDYSRWERVKNQGEFNLAL